MVSKSYINITQLRQYYCCFSKFHFVRQILSTLQIFVHDFELIDCTALDLSIKLGIKSLLIFTGYLISVLR